MSKIKNLFFRLNSKYKELVSKIKIIPNNIFLLLLFVILLIFLIINISNNITVVHKIDKINGVVGEIYKDSVEGKIDTKKLNKIDDFGLYFATYNRKNDSNYELQLLKDEKIIKKISFNPKNYHDNSVKYFKLNIKIDKNSEYKFKVIPKKANKNNSITLIKDNDDIAYEIVQKSDFYFLVIFLSIIFLFLFLTINYLINSEKIKSEISFVLLMLVYIIPSLFLIPPYEVPDEGYHYIKAYKLSQYDLTKNINYNFKKKKLKVPSNFSCIYYSLTNNENVLSKNSIKECFKNKKNVLKVNNDYKSVDRIMVAFPGSLGIKMADIMTNSPLIIFYTGRLFMFFVSFLILLYAIKIIPKYKKILLLVALIPMFLQQMTSYSYDSILNSLCLLQIAYFVKFYYQKETISKKDFILYLISSIFIMQIKIPYLLISISIFFINKEKFGKNKNEKLTKVIIFAISLVLVYFISEYIKDIGYIPAKRTSSALTSKNSLIRGNSFINLIKNPKLVFLIIYNTLKTYNISYFVELIGVFGWLKYHLNSILIIGYYVIMLLIILSEKSIFNKKNRICNLILMMFLIVGIFLGMYLSWTPKGKYVIEGVQGRYFLPLLPMILLMVIPNNNKINLECKTIYSFLNISLFTYLIIILFSYY